MSKLSTFEVFRGSEKAVVLFRFQMSYQKWFAYVLRIFERGMYQVSRRSIFIGDVGKISTICKGKDDIRARYFEVIQLFGLMSEIV